MLQVAAVEDHSALRGRRAFRILIG